jgi:hypothetical protein
VAFAHFGADAVAFAPKYRKDRDASGHMGQVRPGLSYPLLIESDGGEDFLALATQGRGCSDFAHEQNLGADEIHFLWRLRQNAGVTWAPRRHQDVAERGLF